MYWAKALPRFILRRKNSEMSYTRLQQPESGRRDERLINQLTAKDPNQQVTAHTPQSMLRLHIHVQVAISSIRQTVEHQKPPHPGYTGTF